MKLSLQSISSLPLIHSRGVVVSYKRKRYFDLPERLELQERPKNNGEILMEASANCKNFYWLINSNFLCIYLYVVSPIHMLVCSLLLKH